MSVPANIKDHESMLIFILAVIVGFMIGHLSRRLK